MLLWHEPGEPELPERRIDHRVPSLSETPAPDSSASSNYRPHLDGHGLAFQALPSTSSVRRTESLNSDSGRGAGPTAHLNELAVGSASILRRRGWQRDEGLYVADAVIENPILNSPFEEPDRHFRFDDDGITDEIVGAGGRSRTSCRSRAQAEGRQADPFDE